MPIRRMFHSLWAKLNRSRTADYFYLTNLLKNETLVNEQVMDEVMKITKLYIEDANFGQVSTHVISNIAYSGVNVMYLLENGILDCICEIINHNRFDEKLVWKAASAVWNLCGPSNIAHYIPDNLPKVIFECLKIHQNTRNAVYTCIGALSNIAIAIPQQFFTFIHNEGDFETNVLQIISKYPNEEDIPTHASALVANMAVDSDISQICTQVGFVPYLIRVIQSYSHICDVAKHSCAALHNLSDTENFLQHLSSCGGIKILFNLRKSPFIQSRVHFFLQGIYGVAQIPTWASHDLHFASYRGYHHVVCHLLHSEDVNALDVEGLTALERAIQEKRFDIISLLISCGAELPKNFEAKYGNHPLIHKICDSIETGRTIRERVVENIMKNMNFTQYSNLIHDDSSLNYDISKIVLTYIAGVELIKHS